MKIAWLTFAATLAVASVGGVESAAMAKPATSKPAKTLKPATKPVTKPAPMPATKPVTKPTAPGTVHASGGTGAVTKPAVSKAKHCKVGAKEFTGLEYVKGDEVTPGSIYAICAKGVATCFSSDGTSDQTKEIKVACPGAKAGASRQLGVAVAASFTWPHRVICYAFDKSIPEKRQKDFQPIFKTYRDAAKFEFLTLDECTAHAAKLKINVCDSCKQVVNIRAKDPRCFATLGYDPKAKRELYLNAGEKCSVGKLTHEMGHVIGLKHEHQHPDREVVIIRSKLKKEVPDKEFVKFPKDQGTFTAYDKASIMHYNEPEICIPKHKHPKGDAKQRWCDLVETEADHGCVVPLEADCDGTRTKAELTGNAGVLSPGDIATLEALYKSVAKRPGTALDDKVDPKRPKPAAGPGSEELEEGEILERARALRRAVASTFNATASNRH